MRVYGAVLEIDTTIHKASSKPAAFSIDCTSDDDDADCEDDRDGETKALDGERTEAFVTADVGGEQTLVLPLPMRTALAAGRTESPRSLAPATLTSSTATTVTTTTTTTTHLHQTSLAVADDSTQSPLWHYIKKLEQER